jgi:hypothetical protein
VRAKLWLTPWQQNPKVHHRLHKRSPPLSLSWVGWIYTPPPQPVSLEFILIPSSHRCLGLPSGLFPSGFPTNALYTFSSLSCVPHAPPTSSPLTWSAEWYLGMSANYDPPHCVLHSPVTSSLLGPNILLRTLFSNTLSLCSFLNMRDQVSHPYKTTCEHDDVPSGFKKRGRFLD